ncbi:TonB-dependent receptor domain-containing protein [Desertivirga brevis]|uniref:TonB-dependent receptor domain-containing protein n=1 Tax=Desertivirga brevis TaxID=2810310 RepID=UPI001A9669A2|nr:outer membrane beta-barrel family protein [Pedobacter sp. SYSU D00873]
MKHLFIALSAFFFFNTAFAQVPVGGASITGRISGTVLDSLTKKPVDYASVGLGRASSTKSTNGSITDSKGVFKIDNISPGKYKLTISFIGYQTKVITGIETTPGKPDANLGRILLSPSANALKEVTVTGQAAIIENRVDKVVYNAEKDATVSGGNAGDVLRKVPMVTVDQDGNVALRGSQNVRVLINGKPSGAVASSLADAMKMLPADQIKNVEVITSPSAKYDAEGSAGIINIITKKKEMSGVSGSVSGGLGTRQNNGNANLNINKNRLSFTGNFGGNLTWPQTSLTDIFIATNDSTHSQIGETRLKRYGYSTSGNLSYDFNANNSISSGIRYNQGGFSTDGASTKLSNAIASSLGPNSEIIDNENDNKFQGFDWNADFTHKFKKAGHEWSVAGQWTELKSNTDFETFNSRAINNDQIGKNTGINDEYTFQSDYSLPVSSKVKLELGGKFIARRIDSDYDFDKREGGDFVRNTALSNIYHYNQDVYSGYSVWTFTLKNNWGLQAGGRYELTKITGQVENETQNLSPLGNDYDNFIPSLSISKTIKTNSFRLSYSKRIQRPSLQYLNPFRNTSNPLTHTVGNPELSPEISQSVEFNFSTFIKTSVINASVYFRHTDDVIENFVAREAYQFSDGVTRDVSVSTFQNIGNNNSIGASFFGQIQPVKKLTLRGNVNLYTYKPTVNRTFASAASNNNETYLMYNAFLGGSYTILPGFLMETFAIINAPRRTAQGRNPSFNMWQLSFNKEILNKKGKLGLNMVDPFNERKSFNSSFVGNGITQTNSFSVPFRSIGINFSYQFGKMNFAPQQPKRKRGVNNDDLKQDSGQGGQGPGM